MMMEIKWDDIQVGETAGPLEYDVSAGVVDNFAKAVDDYNDWFIKDSPFGGRIAHPTISATDWSDLVFLKWGPLLSGLHARHSIELFNPLRVGSRVTVTGKIVDKYIKRERKYFKLEYLIVDQDGQKIALHKYVGTVPQ